MVMHASAWRVVRTLFLASLAILTCAGSLRAADTGDKFVLKHWPSLLLQAPASARAMVASAGTEPICDLFANGFDASGSNPGCSSCFDTVSNYLETGVDCGGPSCKGCDAGQQCLSGNDCTTGICNGATGLCEPATCVNGMKDPGETDTDCGGPCAACAVGKQCNTGSDCNSLVCNPGTFTCTQPSCADAVKNGDETDVDCGGSCVSKCQLHRQCSVNVDCVSNVCDAVSHTCLASSCVDGMQDLGETDIDCGGPSCAPCGTGKQCVSGSDCASSVCNGSGMCSAPTCNDGVRNGDETGVDCGGATCMTACNAGQGCEVFSDCASNSCVDHVCQ